MDYNPNYRDKVEWNRTRKQKPRLIFIPLAEDFGMDLKDVLNVKFDGPDYCVLHHNELEPHHYYQIGKLAARITRKNEYRNYYLFCEGPPALICIITAKLVGSIGSFKSIEMQGDLSDIRSLDVP